jgi:hypothetical protein
VASADIARTQNDVFRQIIDETGNIAIDHVTINQCINPTIATSSSAGSSLQSIRACKARSGSAKAIERLHLKT